MLEAVAEPTADGHRFAAPFSSAAVPAQRIPRHIRQTGFSFAASVGEHRSYMRKWWQLNPEYEYTFYSDAAALRFVEAHAAPSEVQAYRSVRMGAQKADLFRLVALRYAGGVYADADTELRHPLRSFVPAGASAVVGRFWGSEFMAFEPGHPLLARALQRVSANVLRQVRWIRAGNRTAHCKSPHSCVLQVTGPMALRDAFAKAAKAMGCRPPGSICRVCQSMATCPEPMRALHVCTNDTGDIYRTWACDAAYHWDCRNSGARRRCSAGHYSKNRRGDETARLFFDVDAINATNGPPERKNEVVLDVRGPGAGPLVRVSKGGGAPFASLGSRAVARRGVGSGPRRSFQ